MKNALIVSAAIAGIMWVSYLLDLVLPGEFTSWGIEPRSLSGLKGIVFAPFIHHGFLHIISNTSAVFILTFVLFKFYEEVAAKVWAGSAAIGGSLVWLLGRPAMHVGVSGVIFSLIGFLISAGIFKFNLKSLAIAVVILFMYGGTVIFGVLPVNPFVSWEGHLFGLIAGIGIAYYMYKIAPKDNSGDNNDQLKAID